MRHVHVAESVEIEEVAEFVGPYTRYDNRPTGPRLHKLYLTLGPPKQMLTQWHSARAGE